MENDETVEEIPPCNREVNEWLAYLDVTFDADQNEVPDAESHICPIYNLTVPNMADHDI